MLQGHGYGASVSRGVPVYSPAFAGTKLYCLVTEAHRCEKLDQSFYAAVPRRDSNPRPLDRESDTLPQHHDATATATKLNHHKIVSISGCDNDWLVIVLATAVHTAVVRLLAVAIF